LTTSVLNLKNFYLIYWALKKKYYYLQNFLAHHFTLLSENSVKWCAILHYEVFLVPSCMAKQTSAIHTTLFLMTITLCIIQIH